ncbi:MAG: cyclase family protein [Lachnospiraceae bacterium]|nr:cyclase family protein [Lachnospiraceae bacterium]
MRIYDISQEVFSSKVYPGDPAPKRRQLHQMAAGAEYELSAFAMCTHNGTHVDAPSHFCKGGKTVGELDPEKLIGNAYVALHEGRLTTDDAIAIMSRAREADRKSRHRILLKGQVEVSLRAARALVDAGVCLLGCEGLTLGNEKEDYEIHRVLLQEEVVILEGLRLTDVGEGAYWLNAMPLHLGNAEAAPCRAILLDM